MRHRPGSLRLGRRRRAEEGERVCGGQRRGDGYGSGGDTGRVLSGWGWWNGRG